MKSPSEHLLGGKTASGRTTAWLSTWSQRTHAPKHSSYQHSLLHPVSDRLLLLPSRRLLCGLWSPMQAAGRADGAPWLGTDLSTATKGAASPPRAAACVGAGESDRQVTATVTARNASGGTGAAPLRSQMCRQPGTSFRTRQCADTPPSSPVAIQLPGTEKASARAWWWWCPGAPARPPP